MLHFHVLCAKADILRRQKRSTHRATRKVPKRNENKFLKPPSVRGRRSREILILKTPGKLANIEKCYNHQALISHDSTLPEKELFVLFVTVFLEGCEDEEGECGCGWWLGVALRHLERKSAAEMIISTQTKNNEQK